MIEEFKQFVPPPPTTAEPAPVQPLDYAQPRSTPSIPDDPRRPLRVFRRVGFILGMTLVGCGLGEGLPRSHDATTLLGWGGFFLGCTIPLGRR